LIEYLKYQPDKVKKYLAEASPLYLDSSSDMKWAKVFYDYIGKLVKYQEENSDLYNKTHEHLIYVIGESHCLSPAHLIVNLAEKDYKIIPRFVSGCKIHHIISSYKNQYNAGFNILINNISNNSKVLFCFGEIDCRIDEGIMSFYNKNPTIDIETHIKQMISKYITLLLKKASEKQLDILIQGVPAPNINLSNIDQKEKNCFLHIVRYFNHQLKNECSKYAIKFLDVYNLTTNEYGASNGLYNLDGHHLKPHYINMVM
jgi:hypothetical protein